MKMRLRFILVTAICAAFLAGTGDTLAGARLLPAQKGSGAPALAEDESGVYAAIFADLFQATSETPIMIVDHTSKGVPPGLWTVTSVQGPDTTKFLAQIAQDARQDYQTKNKESMRLVGECKIAPRCEFDNVVALTGIVGGEKGKMDRGWKEFEKRFPDAPGIFMVSRIGFDFAHTQAIAYAAKSCGKQCGDGYYIWLAKRNGAWAVAAQTTIWIAGADSK